MSKKGKAQSTKADPVQAKAVQPPVVAPAQGFGSELDGELLGSHSSGQLLGGGSVEDGQVAMLRRMGPAQRAAHVQRLTRTQGNAHIGRIISRVQNKPARPKTARPLSPPPIQTKLTVNEPGDQYEQEADRVADEVMRKPQPAAPDAPEDDETPQISRSIQRAESASDVDVTPDIENRVGQLDGSGSALPNETRGFFEERMGADLSKVRVHTDSSAVQLSQDLNARAFTTGNNIAFNSGAYNPDSDEGKHLLAHELTHTVQQGASPAVQRRVLEDGQGGGVADPAAAMEGGATAPLSAEEDPAFQTVVTQTEDAATQEEEHDPTALKVTEAEDSAEMPPEEKKGKAQDVQAGRIDSAAETQAAAVGGGSIPGFDKAAFKNALKAKIDSLVPADEDAFENVGGNMGEVKTAVTQQVSGAKDNAQGEVDDRVEQAPDEASVAPKPVTPLEADDPGAVPDNVTGELAAPKPKTAAELEQPLSTESATLDQQMAEAQITDEQLANSNEPDFIATLDAKDEAQTGAVEIPAGYRVNEQGLLESAETNQETAVTDQLGVMHDGRTELFGDVDGLQTDTKETDEAKRQEIGTAINGIYEETKTKVTETLNKLDTDVDTIFNNGAEAAKNAFVTNARSRGAAYKEERYGDGLIDGGLGGLWNRGRDAVVGLPDEYLQIYNDERDKYVAAMDIVIDDITNVVATALTTARQQIAEGRQAITEYVDSQPEELREIAQQCADDVQAQFDALEQQVNDKQTELVDDLAQRYADELATVDAVVDEARAETRGLLGMAQDLIESTIGAIFEMRDLLMSVVDGAMGVVMEILKNPVTFVSNLFTGVTTGLQNFVSNIATHLETGFVEWLTGTLTSAGITLPADILSLEGMSDIAFQLLGLTYDALRSRAAGILGEPIVSALESGFEVVMILRNEGLIGAWDYIQEQLATLKDTVVDGLKEMLTSEVIEAGISWLIGLLGGPAGAFIRACKAIYDLVMWFRNNASNLMALVQSVVDGVKALANGDVNGLTNAVEAALGRFVPTAIGFLASLLGLGDISTKVRRVIDRVKDPIDRAVEYVLELVRGFVQKIAKMLGFNSDSDAVGEEGVSGPGQLGKSVTFTANDEVHKLYVADSGDLKLKGELNQNLSIFLGRVGTQIPHLGDEVRPEAESKLSIVQANATSAEEKARILAQKNESVKTLEDGPIIEQTQAQLESEQDVIAQNLPALLESVEIESGLATLRKETNSHLEEGAITEENAELASGTAKSGHDVFSSIEVVQNDKQLDYEYVARAIEPGAEALFEVDPTDTYVNPSHQAPPSGGGTWNLELMAKLPTGDEVGWGTGHIERDGDGQPLVGPDGPHLTLYPIDIKLRIKGSSKTRRALEILIEVYENTYGQKPPELPGMIAWGNLSNFQQEYGRNIAHGMGEDAAAQAAIRAISFGKHRMALGYSSFQFVGLEGAMNMEIEIEGELVNVQVPTYVEIVASS